MRRAARYLAISSKKSTCALKKKLRRGANASTASPAASADSTYANPLASVNASSCAAVDPASRMWYPEIETGCQRGSSAVAKRTTSVTSRIDGRGGNTNSFCAWYSFRMSFWIVPPRRARSTPCWSPTRDVHREQRGRGGVDGHRRADRAEVDVGEQQLEVDERVDGDAALVPPRRPPAGRRSRVRAASACRTRWTARSPPAASSALEPLVGVLGGAEAGELPHGPELLSGTSRRRGPGCRGTRRGARRRPGRTPRRARCPTSWCAVAGPACPWGVLRGQSRTLRARLGAPV